MSKPLLFIFEKNIANNIKNFFFFLEWGLSLPQIRKDEEPKRYKKPLLSSRIKNIYTTVQVSNLTDSMRSTSKRLKTS